MIVSDLSVTRPVLATVLSLLLVAFGLVAFDRLPLREYPDIDPPVVSVETVYPGAAANVVETRITQLIEDRIAGVEGIRTMESSSRGRSLRHQHSSSISIATSTAPPTTSAIASPASWISCRWRRSRRTSRRWTATKTSSCG
jgi:multidrug efflux pump subunit AcrB